MKKHKVLCLRTIGEEFTKGVEYTVSDGILCDRIILNNYNISVPTHYIENFKETFQNCDNDELDAEKIYRNKELEYLTQDAQHQMAAYLDSNNETEKAQFFNNEDYGSLAVLFQYNKDCNVADNITWENIIEQYIKDCDANKDVLAEYVSDDGYIIPVEWSVCSTVRVDKADNLKQAVEIARARIMDLPCDNNAEYIDGSYTIPDDDESLLNAQAYSHESGVSIDENQKIWS